MNILEALKYAGQKELKYFVWGDSVVAKIESAGVALNITTEATGEEVLVAIDTLSHELQIEILTKHIAHETEDPVPSNTNKDTSPKRRTILNYLIQTLLSLGGVVMLLIFVFVTYDTTLVTTGTEEDGNGFIGSMVDLLLWVAKFIAHGIGS